MEQRDEAESPVPGGAPETEPGHDDVESAHRLSGTACDGDGSLDRAARASDQPEPSALLGAGGVPPFVSAAWVRAHRDEVVLADVRWYPDDRDPHDAYLAAHLPGAVYVDLDDDLAGPAGPRGRHPLPDPEQFAAALGARGIGEDDVVVAYDDAGGAIAARLAWMLRVTGRSAAVLDGGVEAWDGPVETGPVTLGPAELSVRPWPADRVADVDEVAGLADDAGARLVDARDPERYRGEQEDLDPRAGHIPGAVNLPFAGDFDASGRLRDGDELFERFAGAALVDAGDVVVYCGSGVTACHEALAMELVGIDARLYAGSWSEWSRDPDRPAVTGGDG